MSSIQEQAERIGRQVKAAGQSAASYAEQVFINLCAALLPNVMHTALLSVRSENTEGKAKVTGTVEWNPRGQGFIVKAGFPTASGVIDAILMAAARALYVYQNPPEDGEQKKGATPDKYMESARKAYNALSVNESALLESAEILVRKAKDKAPPSLAPWEIVNGAGEQVGSFKVSATETGDGAVSLEMIGSALRSQGFDIRPVEKKAKSVKSAEEIALEQQLAALKSPEQVAAEEKLRAIRKAKREQKKNVVLFETKTEGK